MKESYEEVLASRLGLESYADDGNIVGVASTYGVHAGQPLSSEINTSRVPTQSDDGEGNTRCGVIGKPHRDTAESEPLCMCGNSKRENREILSASDFNGGMSPEIGTISEHLRWND